MELGGFIMHLALDRAIPPHFGSYLTIPGHIWTVQMDTLTC